MPVPPQDGGPPAAVAKPSSTGWLLGGRYRVIDRIGTGGMAEVFRAHDDLLGRDVAVKVFRAHADPADSSGGAQRQEIELQTLARLGHPNLITLFDGSIGNATGPAYLVMELINGPSLSARIADGPLVEAEARQVGIQIADALAYVHAQGMVHRDVKPANILLGTDTTTGDTTVRARLSDFGIVRLMGSERLTTVDFLVGTASYLAPEQARGIDVGPPADVYALGLVLIETLTGEQSFPGPAVESVMARLARSPEIPSGLPAPWPQLLAAMTVTDPAARPAASDVAAALRSGETTALVSPVSAAGGAVAAAAGAAAGAALGGAALGGAALGESATTVFPAVGAASAASGTAAGAPLAAAEPVSSASDPTEGYPPTGGSRAGWYIAALLLLIVLAAGGYLLYRPRSSQSPAAPSTSRPASTAATTAAGTPTTSASTPSSSAASSSPPTTTAASTSRAPATSSAPRTSSAPTTSAASSTPPASPGAGSTAPGISTTPSGAAATSSPVVDQSVTGSPSVTVTTSTPAPGG